MANAPAPAPGTPFWQGNDTPGRWMGGGAPSPPADPAYAQLGLQQGGSASDAYAALTQEMWQQYESTFVPIENKLIAYATDPTQAAQAMSAAKTDVDQSFTAQQGALQRQQTGEGVVLNTQQQGAQAREQDLSHSLAGVQAQNVAHDLTIQNQQSILGNPAPTVSAVAQAAAQLGS